MLTISLRDLQFRRRRFAVGVLGTALVLGITLVLSGIPAAFDNEARRTVESFSAEAWIVPAGVTGPFLSTASMPAGVADEVRRATGGEADPIVMLGGVITGSGASQQANIHGIPPGSFAEPPLAEGRQPSAPGEIVVNTSVSADLGDPVVLNGRGFVVVGRTKGLSYKAGLATVSITLADAQGLGFGGAELATAVASRQPLSAPPEGYSLISPDAARRDMIEPLKNPKQALVVMQWLLWVVATMIVGSVVYLSALDRLRDFAVFKAIGADDRSVVAGLIAQALLLCAIAYGLGLVISKVIVPFVPIQSEVPRFAYVGLAGVAIGIAVLASLAGARRAVSVDPALAFGAA